MPNRFVFRQVDYRDIQTFLSDGAIRSKNYKPAQSCHQTSYQNLVDRRGTEMFQLPCKRVIHDCVAFYFSPATSFTFAIHKGNVPVLAPDGTDLGFSQLVDRAFVVCSVDTLQNSRLRCYFSDFALNSQSLLPTIFDDLSLIDARVYWDMFDEAPIVAAIPEVGYAGVCRWFHSRTEPRYQQRKEKRMAEFLVYDSLPLDLVACIVVPNEEKRVLLQQQMDRSAYSIPIFNKPGCFLS